MNQKEKILLLKLQSDFPLVTRPYQEIGRRFGWTEKEVIDKLKKFQKKGIIRYIGGAFNLKKLKIKSTLVALSVSNKKLPRVVKIINKYPNVTHNYLRKYEFVPPSQNFASKVFSLHQSKRKNSMFSTALGFNLWFTVSSTSKKRLLNIVNEIKKKTRTQNMLNLITHKVFKIDARFKI